MNDCLWMYHQEASYLWFELSIVQLPEVGLFGGISVSVGHAHSLGLV